MIYQIRRFIEDESGATAVEYGLIAALVTLAIAVGLRSFGNSLANVFTAAGSGLGG